MNGNQNFNNQFNGNGQQQNFQNNGNQQQGNFQNNQQQNFGGQQNFNNQQQPQNFNNQQQGNFQGGGGMGEMFVDDSQEASSGYGDLPKGAYLVQITNGEYGPNNNNTGNGLNLENTVIDGPYSGRKIFDYYNMQHSNPTAQNIGQANYAKLCQSLGLQQRPRNAGDMFGAIYVIEYGPRKPKKKENEYDTSGQEPEIVMEVKDRLPQHAYKGGAQQQQHQQQQPMNLPQNNQQQNFNNQQQPQNQNFGGQQNNVQQQQQPQNQQQQQPQNQNFGGANFQPDASGQNQGNGNFQNGQNNGNVQQTQNFGQNGNSQSNGAPQGNQPSDGNTQNVNNGGAPFGQGNNGGGFGSGFGM